MIPIFCHCGAAVSGKCKNRHWGGLSQTLCAKQELLAQLEPRFARNVRLL
jgi:hypothetical protein